MWFRKIKKALRILVFIAGSICILFTVLSFTRIPYDLHRWLGLSASHYSAKPHTFIMLGGSGMPSESNLIRLYYSEKLLKLNKTARLLLAHPTDTTVINLMISEITSKGIDRKRITIEKTGTNTRSQALAIAESNPDLKNNMVVLITSPENMRRSVLSFRKAGFKNVGGEPAFENAMFADLSYNHLKVGGNRMLPDVSHVNKLRYDFWNYLKLEIICLRELTALVYYKLNGWI